MTPQDVNLIAIEWVPFYVLYPEEQLNAPNSSGRQLLLLALYCW